MCSGVIQQVNARINLAAHGVCNNTNGATHTRLPRAERHGVKRARAIKWQARTARNALCGGHADANARK